jgi:WD40 repeat protein
MALALSPDGKLVATGDSDNGVTLWDAAEGKEFVTFPKDVVSVLAFSPDGKQLAAAAKVRQLKEPSGEIHLWDVAAILKSGKKRSEP